MLTVDSSGNVTATASLNAQAAVGGGTYISGLTATGTGTCTLAFTNGGGTGATANVTVPFGAGTLVMITPGYGYSTAPTQASVAYYTSSTCALASGFTSVNVSTYLTGSVNVLASTQPYGVVGGTGSIWFDNTTDWPLPVPMGVDSSGNISAMVRTARGTATGAYTPYYWGVGSFSASGLPPTATWTVYDSTPTQVGPATVVIPGLLGLTATSGGPYSGTSVLTYCVKVSSSGTAFTWDTVGTCTANTGPSLSTCTSGSACGLSNGVTVYFNGSSGTPGQESQIQTGLGGTTSEVIQAGLNQSGSLWTVKNNLAARYGPSRPQGPSAATTAPGAITSASPPKTSPSRDRMSSTFQRRWAPRERFSPAGAPRTS